MNSQVFVILFWFLVEHFKLSARTKDARDTRDAFLESVYWIIWGLSSIYMGSLKHHIRNFVESKCDQNSMLKGFYQDLN